MSAAPIFLDREATTEKVCQLIAEAGRAGSKLTVFPEVLIPGYPYWIWLMTPTRGAPYFVRLYKNLAIVGPDGQFIGGPLTDKEDIVYAEIDLEQIILAKYACDSAGHYARPDVLRLVADLCPQPVWEPKQAAEPARGPAPVASAEPVPAESKLDL